MWKRIINYKKAREELRRNYQTQAVLNKVLGISLEDISLDEMLERIIDFVVTIPWLTSKPKGAVFLIEDDPDVLVMKTQRGLPPALQATCARVPTGECLCGRAASSSEIIFTNHVDKRHQRRYEGIFPHGHYCVPILSSARKTLGVLNLYLEEGHPCSEREKEFLTAVANTLAGLIERKRAAEKLAEIIKLKEEFVSVVSHELRTTITAIKEGINIASDETGVQTGEERKRFLNIARMNAERLAKLVEDVLRFQKVKAGNNNKAEPDIRENDMNEVVREVFQTLRSLADKKGLDFVLELEENLPKIRFDRDKIIQVLVNLVDNAIKFTEKGRVTVTTVGGANIVKVSVEDTGVGIKREDMPCLFSRFGQVKTDKGEERRGTGLGLAISKEIIDGLKGKFGVESEPGRGTRFYFILPVSERRS